jgi:myo-inositol-1(or 4)-monophosphatase
MTAARDRTPLEDERLHVAPESVLEVGQRQREETDVCPDPTYKSRGELVTHIDREAEETILDRILSQYPGHRALAEESGRNSGSSRSRWIIDPIDGTTNFYHGFPAFSVSVALERRGTVELGVVYHVPRDLVFTGVRNRGAYRETEQLGVSGEIEFRHSLIATGFDRAEPPPVEPLVAVVSDSHGLRRTGSAAIDLAYVAAGRLLVEEAGGSVTDYAGNSYSLRADTDAIVASNGRLHDALRERVATVGTE